MLGASLLVPLWWQPPDLGTWLTFAVIGAAGHVLVILALQRAEASRVSPFTYVQLLWAMLASLLMFDDVPSVWTVLGALVIAASGLQLYRLGLREQARVERPADEVRGRHEGQRVSPERLSWCSPARP
jgi:drug/metabolite transporter (DMT)-like permease